MKFLTVFLNTFLVSLIHPLLTTPLHTHVTNDLSLVDLNSYTLSLTNIFNELDHLSNNTNSDLDNIPDIFFTECKFVLAIPLLYLFKLSFKSGIFPACWKLSYITLVFKGGDNC